jgi:hypothetical protein
VSRVHDGGGDDGHGLRSVDQGSRMEIGAGEGDSDGARLHPSSALAPSGGGSLAPPGSVR